MTTHTAKVEHRCMFCGLPIMAGQRYGQEANKDCHLSCAVTRGMEVDKPLPHDEFMMEWLAVEAGLFVKGKK